MIEGSNFADALIGSDRNETFRALDGFDTIAANGGDDFIDEGSSANGRDTIGGGPGAGDRVSYGTRVSGVKVSLDGATNDGAFGENDNVGGSVEHIFGSNFADTLTGNGSANTIDGFGGPDIIDGLGGNDTLSAGASTTESSAAPATTSSSPATARSTTSTAATTPTPTRSTATPARTASWAASARRSACCG